MKSRRYSKKGFFKGNFSLSWKFLKESKDFIYVAVGIFLFFVILGSIFPVPNVLKTELLKLVKELVNSTVGMNFYQITLYIFWNNIRSAFSAMIFGIFFGLVPVIGAIFNGYLLGFVASKSVSQQGILVLWRLFPHGIFELPAILIAMGIGMKLGSVWFLKNKLFSLKDYLVNAVRVFFFIVLPLLVVAALIEGALITLVG